MRESAIRLRAWLQDRTTVGPEEIQSLNRGLPKGVGWLHTLGSVLVALLAVQALTGIVLAMYYVPHPDAAYETTRFIDRDLPMGRLVHGIHRYADSALIIVLGLHLLRTYIQAAYKAPRELTWISGILLLTLLIGFGFTGYLLPWDQNGYFSTLVRTQYAADLPVIGPIAQMILRGGTRIGALTISRFYAIHTLLLPALLLLLLQAHLALAWRKGPTPPAARVGEEAPAASRFVEHQLFKNALAIFVVIGLLFFFAIVRPVELEFKANPADPTYEPRAEWYFLFLFQLVRDFTSIPALTHLSWIPVAVLPGIAMTFLALAPWIDRGPERKPARRPLMMGALAVGLVAMVALTVRAYATLHPNATPSHSLYGHFTKGDSQDLPPDLVEAGAAAYGKAAPPCGVCHVAYQDYTTGRSGPDLTGYGLLNFPLGKIKGHPEAHSLPYYDRFARYVRGDLRPPDSRMPKYSKEALSEQDLAAIGAYLSQDPRKARPIIHQGTRVGQ